MANRTSLRVQAEELVARALDVARFSARISKEWLSTEPSKPTAVGSEVRRKLKADSRKAADAFRAALKALFEAEQLVLGASESSDEVFDQICRDRDAKRQLAEGAAVAAPATAAAALDETLKKFEEAQRDNDPAAPRCRRDAVVLDGLVTPVLARFEREIAERMQKERLVELRRCFAEFESAVRPLTDDLARLSPDGGRKLLDWHETSWSRLLLAVVRDLLQAVDAGRQRVMGQVIEALQAGRLLVDIPIELAKVGEVESKPAAAAQDGWGPELTFKAVCSAILARKKSAGSAQEVRDGDMATREEVMQLVRAGDVQKLPDAKASQYLTPKGRLVALGWVRREGVRVVVTESGAREWREKNG